MGDERVLYSSILLLFRDRWTLPTYSSYVIWGFPGHRRNEIET